MEPCLLNSGEFIKGGIFITKNTTKEYFTRFPNEYIRCNIKKDYGVSRKFYITYILIDKYRSYENYSWITIRKILNFYGYKTNKNKPKAVYEILDVLEYMINNKMIKVSQDLDSLSYDTGIEIEIIPENFDCAEKFTMITSSQLNTIMMADSSLNKENILLAFLYINSYIGCRSKKDDGTEYENAKENPEAFFKSLESMAKEISMSKDTINQTLDYLVSNEEHPALLVRKNVGSIPATKSQPPKNVPNIYVLNKNGYQREIKWALDKMLEVYNVKTFNKTSQINGE